MMYTSLLCAAVIITVYFASMAAIDTIHPGMAIFTRRSAICVILGSILGIFVSEPLFSSSKELGFIGLGASIGLMYILFYSGIIRAMINHIPANVRHGFRTAFNIIRIILIVAIIILAVIGILHFVGV